MAIVIGMQILYGDMPEAELPKLPDGWRYQTEKQCWVLVISPKGETYYVGANRRLYPRRTRTLTGTFYLDDREGVIELPPTE